MSRVFLDTSAIVKHYHVEKGTPQVDALFDDPTNVLLISELSLVEFVSALRRLKNSKVITDETFTEALGKFDTDTDQRFVIISLNRELFKRARSLVQQHVLRTLDALQLACSSSPISESPVFVSSDDHLLVAAKAEGFVTLNPLKESPSPREDVPDSPPQ